MRRKTEHTTSECLAGLHSTLPSVKGLRHKGRVTTLRAEPQEGRYQHSVHAYRQGKGGLYDKGILIAALCDKATHICRQKVAVDSRGNRNVERKYAPTSIRSVPAAVIVIHEDGGCGD